MAFSDPEGGSGLELERLVFFSDAVFAIAITLLVIDLKLPPEANFRSEREAWQALGATLPRLLGFVISFLVIGAYWVGHHRMFRYIVRYNDSLLWRNLLLLMWIAFLPFPTSVFSEYGRGQMPLVLYAASLGLAGLSSLWVWRYASHNGLVATGTEPQTIKYLTLRAVAIPFVCLISIGISFFDAVLARWSFCLIPAVQRIAQRLGSKRR